MCVGVFHRSSLCLCWGRHANTQRARVARQPTSTTVALKNGLPTPAADRSILTSSLTWLFPTFFNHVRDDLSYRCARAHALREGIFRSPASSGDSLLGLNWPPLPIKDRHRLLKGALRYFPPVHSQGAAAMALHCAEGEGRCWRDVIPFAACITDRRPPLAHLGSSAKNSKNVPTVPYPGSHTRRKFQRGRGSATVVKTVEVRCATCSGLCGPRETPKAVSIFPSFLPKCVLLQSLPKSCVWFPSSPPRPLYSMSAPVNKPPIYPFLPLYLKSSCWELAMCKRFRSFVFLRQIYRYYTN